MKFGAIIGSAFLFWRIYSVFLTFLFFSAIL
jgi:hypothetical protein